MEILNIVGLLLIAATNAWIALQIKAQKTETNLDVKPQISIDVPEMKVVTLQSEIDYDKLAEALAKQPAPIITVTAPAPVVPSPQIPYSGPYWQSPIVSDSVSVTDNTEYFTINDGRDVPVKTFPKRTVNARGDSAE